MRSLRWFLAAVTILGCASPAALPRDDDAGSDPAPSTNVPPDGDAGVLVPEEAGSTDASDASTGGLQVFVTSVATVGNMGGLAGADTICQGLGQHLGARWAAWLSVEDGPHAVDRVTSAGPWLLPTGEVVAADKASLLGGRLAHAINRDENGVIRSGENVWTGSGTNGKYSGKDCDRWTTGTNGGIGSTDATDGHWTDDDDESCKNARRLYCFEL